jgi:serine/threonine protein kinase
MESKQNLEDGLLKESFIFQSKIGEGSFGKVHKCTNSQKPNKFFAIKRIFYPQDDSEDSIEQRKEVTREIQNLTRLRSYSFKPSALPKNYGYYQEIDNYNEINVCLVFDYYPFSLRKFLNQQKEPLPFPQLMDFFISLIHGFSFLQAINITHRDLKPENFAIDEFGHIKILDFGFAKDLSILVKTSLKNELTLGGTEGYMAPELLEELTGIIKPDKKRDVYKSDAFSFGLVILEMGTLQKIVHQRDLAHYQTSVKSNLKIFKKNYSLIETQNFKQIYKILRHCLKSDPEQRWDFSEMYKYCFAQKNDRLVYHIFLDDLPRNEFEGFFQKEDINSKIYEKEKENNKKKNEEFDKKIADIEKEKNEEFDKKIADIEKENQDLINENQDLKNNLKALKRAGNESKEQLNLITTQLEEATNFNEILKRDRDKQNTKVSNLENELKQLQTFVDELIQQTSDKKPDDTSKLTIDSLRNKIIVLEKHSNGCENSLKKKKEKIKSYKVMIEDLQNQLMKRDEAEQKKIVQKKREKNEEEKMQRIIPFQTFFNIASGMEDEEYKNIICNLSEYFS